MKKTERRNKIKFNGFTLAEMLVALTLIGIVATLTLPALNSNIQRQHVGPALLRAIATLETANALYTQENDIISFSNTCSNYVANCFLNEGIAGRIGAARVDIQPYTGVDLLSGSVEANKNNFDTRNGFAYIFRDNNVYIDINGTTKGPNTYGRDLFLTVMDNDGRIFPYGSKVKLNDNDPTWENGNCDSASTNNVATCAGSIVDHGGRVIYPW